MQPGSLRLHTNDETFHTIQIQNIEIPFPVQTLVLFVIVNISLWTLYPVVVLLDRTFRLSTANLLMNCSSPTLLSSMNDSSNIPSSPRKGSCLFSAFPGRGGTTIYKTVTRAFQLKSNHRREEKGSRW